MHSPQSPMRRFRQLCHVPPERVPRFWSPRQGRVFRIENSTRPQIPRLCHALPAKPDAKVPSVVSCAPRTKRAPVANPAKRLAKVDVPPDTNDNPPRSWRRWRQKHQGCVMRTPQKPVSEVSSVVSCTNRSQLPKNLPTNCRIHVPPFVELMKLELLLNKTNATIVANRNGPRNSGA